MGYSFRAGHGAIHVKQIRILHVYIIYYYLDTYWY